MDNFVANLHLGAYITAMSKQQARNYVKTKFEGVFYRYSAKKNPKTGDYDKIYAFWYSDPQGKGHWKTVGRHSEGYRPINARDARNQFLTEYNQTGINPAVRDAFTVGNAIDAYKVWCEHEGKKNYGRFVVYDVHVRDALHNMPVASITPGIITELKGKLLASYVESTKDQIKKNGEIISKERKLLAPATVKDILKFIRAAINRAIYNGLWRGVNPFSTKEGWTMPRENNKRLRFLTKEEAKALLGELEMRHPQLHDMVLLSLRTGLRPTEMFRLKGEDVDATANVIYIMAKGQKRVPVRVPKNIIQMLLSYNRRAGEFIFQRPENRGAFTRTPDSFGRAVKKLGLAPIDGNPLYAVTLHTMRHTFASWLAQSGKVSIMELQKLLRHEDIAMTMRYAHLFPGQESEKLSIIGEILE